VRRGTGTGFFGPPVGPWLGRTSDIAIPVGATGGGRTDLVERLDSFDPPVLLANPALGSPREAETAPPEVALLLRPEIVNLVGLPQVEEPAWRVGVLAGDGCGATRVTLLRADHPHLPPDIPRWFETAEETRFVGFEVPETGDRQIVLQGPDESVTRDLCSAAQAAGGWPLRKAHRLEIL
jgi:hypothetical protein